MHLSSDGSRPLIIFDLTRGFPVDEQNPLRQGVKSKSRSSLSQAIFRSPTLFSQPPYLHSDTTRKTALPFLIRNESVLKRNSRKEIYTPLQLYPGNYPRTVDCLDCIEQSALKHEKKNELHFCQCRADPIRIRDVLP